MVTVDGILLTKSGTMTGGLSGGMEAKSNKWDDSAIQGIHIHSLFVSLVLILFYFPPTEYYFIMQPLRKGKINWNQKWKVLDH